MKPQQQRLLAAGMCFAGCLLLPAARAQAVSVKDIARCATIEADAERLACYDQLARSTPAEGRAPAAAPPPAHPDQSFGMIKPPANKPPEPSRMDAKVVGVTADSRGGVVVQLDNHQTWTLDDGPTLLRTGDAIVIKRAALGSFLMTTKTGRVYRVRRLE